MAICYQTHTANCIYKKPKKSRLLYAKTTSPPGAEINLSKFRVFRIENWQKQGKLHFAIICILADTKEQGRQRGWRIMTKIVVLAKKSYPTIPSTKPTIQAQNEQFLTMRNLKRHLAFHNLSKPLLSVKV